MFALPLKDKRGPSVAEAFEVMFIERVPILLQTDQGSEFLNYHVQNVFKKNNVKHYWNFSEFKASCAESVIRTFKTRLFRYMTSRHRKRWIDVLSAFIDSYNKSYHRMSPNDVTLENSQQVADPSEVIYVLVP